ncbi:hypothetical protein [Streptomyces sp. ALI-76-A]|jgi:hypothetical protein|uniref:hypothetical protein n=1 Tax=Streptomyces sp. ALI-76-A TaxID=3025736 RepID=UPI00256EFBA8|nr:hypothetical protein [Streptomyces sp. ALI-76-A]MDL5199213.1 hypothetical protein [Streptomyces sp. ALI-76-A]
MYEMRAEPGGDQGELVWHVMSKDASGHPLCGRRLTRVNSATSDEKTAERYCAPCMTAFRDALQDSPA